MFQMPFRMPELSVIYGLFYEYKTKQGFRRLIGNTGRGAVLRDFGPAGADKII
jgi:hypothetical protein